MKFCILCIIYSTVTVSYITFQKIHVHKTCIQVHLTASVQPCNRDPSAIDMHLNVSMCPACEERAAGDVRACGTHVGVCAAFHSKWWFKVPVCFPVINCYPKPWKLPPSILWCGTDSQRRGVKWPPVTVSVLNIDPHSFVHLTKKTSLTPRQTAVHWHLENQSRAPTIQQRQVAVKGVSKCVKMRQLCENLTLHP